MNTNWVDSTLAPTRALAYYHGPEIDDVLLRALADAELDPRALDIDDLAQLDEFHALGRAATVALADLASVEADQRVLDIGAGLGGPARFLAARRGARDRPGRDPTLLPSSRATDARRRSGRSGGDRLRRRAGAAVRRRFIRPRLKPSRQSEHR